MARLPEQPERRHTKQRSPKMSPLHENEDLARRPVEVIAVVVILLIFGVVFVIIFNNNKRLFGTKIEEESWSPVISAMKVGFGENCRWNRQCIQPDLICEPRTRKCKCKDPFVYKTDNRTYQAFNYAVKRCRSVVGNICTTRMNKDLGEIKCVNHASCVLTTISLLTHGSGFGICKCNEGYKEMRYHYCGRPANATQVERELSYYHPHVIRFQTSSSNRFRRSAFVTDFFENILPPNFNLTRMFDLSSNASERESGEGPLQNMTRMEQNQNNMSEQTFEDIKIQDWNADVENVLSNASLQSPPLETDIENEIAENIEIQAVASRAHNPSKLKSPNYLLLIFSMLLCFCLT